MQAISRGTELGQVSNARAVFFADGKLIMRFSDIAWTKQEVEEYQTVATRHFITTPVTRIIAVFQSRLPGVVTPVELFWNKTQMVVILSAKLHELPPLPPNIQQLRIENCAIDCRVVITGKQLGTTEHLVVNDFEGGVTLHIQDSKVQTLDVKLKQDMNWDKVCFGSFPATLSRLKLQAGSVITSISQEVFKGLSAAKRGANGGAVQVQLIGCDIYSIEGNERKILSPERLNAQLYPYVEIQSDRRPPSARDTVRTYLANKLIGQPHAVEAGSDVLLQAYSNSIQKGPKAVALFFGPTGVGKTELAKLFVSFMSSQENIKPYHFHRIDMAEYSEPHSKSKLMGTTAGYVGYGKTETLVDVLEKNPRTILLLDEFEKADKSVLKLFLGMMDDGSLQDGKGKKADCSQLVIVLTSNVCATELTRFDWSRNDAASAATRMVREVLSRDVSPEFVGRVTTMVPFCPLNREQIIQIIEQQMVDFCSKAPGRYAIQALVVSKEVWMPIVDQTTAEYGARLVSKEVFKQIQVALTDVLASGTIRPGEPVLMKRAQNGQVRCYVA